MILPNYQVKVKSDNVFLRYLDFYIEEYNICIEFDEEYHKNDKQEKLDIERENEIKNSISDIIIYRVNKDDYILNPEKTINDILCFINEKREV